MFLSLSLSLSLSLVSVCEHSIQMHIEAAAEHTKGGVKEVEKAANTYLGKKATAKAKSGARASGR